MYDWTSEVHVIFGSEFIQAGIYLSQLTAQILYYRDEADALFEAGNGYSSDFATSLQDDEA